MQMSFLVGWLCVFRFVFCSPFDDRKVLCVLWHKTQRKSETGTQEYIQRANSRKKRRRKKTKKGKYRWCKSMLYWWCQESYMKNVKNNFFSLSVHVDGFVSCFRWLRQIAEIRSVDPIRLVHTQRSCTFFGDWTPLLPSSTGLYSIFMYFFCFIFSFVLLILWLCQRRRNVRTKRIFYVHT